MISFLFGIYAGIAIMLLFIFVFAACLDGRGEDLIGVFIFAVTWPINFVYWLFIGRLQ